MKNKIEYKGVDYELKEPTIEVWQKLVALKDWADDTEYNITLISSLCDLTEEQVKLAPWDEIVEASQILSNYVIQDGKKFYKEFELQGQVYRFIDLPNLTFGEFIDIDTFLQKPEHEKKNEMNMMMAMLYREVGLNGKILEYDSVRLQNRAEKFKKLPVKYVNGATSFFLRLEKTLHQGIPLSFVKKIKKWMVAIWIVVSLPVLAIFGVGLILSSNLRMKTSPK